MNKKHLTKITTLTAGILLSLGTIAFGASYMTLNKAQAAMAVASLVFKAACGGQGVDDKGNTWTVTSDAAESTFEDARGIHYGTSSKAVSYLKLTSSSINYKITKIVANMSDGYTASPGSINITVGGQNFGASQQVKNVAADYTFEPTGGEYKGIIEVNLSRTSQKKALYCKSIIVTYDDGQAAIPVTGVLLNTAAESMYVRDELQLVASVQPANATNKKVTWSSTNETIASVDENGLVTAKAEGNANITVTTEDGGFTATAAITVLHTVLPMYDLDAEFLEIPDGSQYPEDDSIVDKFQAHKFKTVSETNRLMQGTGDSDKKSSIWNTEYLGKPIGKIVLVIDSSKVAVSSAKAELRFGDAPKDGCTAETFYLGKDGQFPLDTAARIEIVPTASYDYFSLNCTSGASYYKVIEVYEGVPTPTYEVTTNLTNCTYTGPEEIKQGATFKATLTPIAGYAIDDEDVEITMNGEPVQDCVLNGKITITGVTGPINITYSARQLVIVRIAVTSTWHKTSFKIGDEFTYNNIVVTGYTTMEDTPSFNITEACTISVSESAMKTPGEKKVTVKLNDNVSTSYNINVYDIENIQVRAGSVAKAYLDDEEFDLSNVVVEGTWGPQDNRKTEVLDVTLSTTAVPLKGMQEISVSYNYKDLKRNSLTVRAYILEEKDSVSLSFEDRGSSDTSYGDWNVPKKGNTSFLVYAAGNNKSIQLNNEYKSGKTGVVANNNVNFVNSVTITWNTNTSDAHTVEVFGSNTAYTAVADLSDTSKQGTKIGSAEYVKNSGVDEVEIQLSGLYKYIGINAGNGAIYLDKIEYNYVGEVPWLTDLRLLNPKEELYKGDEFEFGGQAIADYSDDSEHDVTDLVTFSEVNMNKLGDQEVTVTFADGVMSFSVKYTVTILDPDEIVKIDMNTDGVKKEFLLGENFSSSKLKVFGTPRRGADVNITRQCTVDYSEFNKDEVGEYTIKVYYKEFEPLTYKVNVVKPVNLTKIELSLASDTLWDCEEFRYNGTVTAFYDDGTNEVISNERANFSYVAMSKTGNHEVTVSYSRINAEGVLVTKEAKYTLTVKFSHLVTGIDIDTSAAKKSYVVGDRFLKDGIEVTAHHANAEDAVITSGFSVDFSKVDMNKVGTYEVSVSYAGFTKTYNISVVAKPVTLVKINVNPSVTEYKVGGQFVKATVTAVYSDGSTKDVTNDATFSGYDLSKVGKSRVTVTYEENDETFSNSYKISVTQDLALVSITVNAETAPTKYKVGDAFVAPQVMARYNDGTVVDVTKDVTFTGFDSSKAGECTVTATFNGKTATFTVTVENAPAPSGCGGNVMTTSIILSSLALLGTALILIKKKKEN